MSSTEVVTNQPPALFDTHYDALQEVFEGMALPPNETATLDGAIELTQPWLKGDHSRPGYALEVPAQHHDRFYEIYDELGMKQELPVPAGEYHDIVLLGAVQAGNRRRVSLLLNSLEEAGITTGHVSLLGGQRRLFPEKETDDVAASFAELDEQGWHTEWSKNVRDLPVSELWETDALRLAMMEKLGPLALDRLVLRNNDSSLHDEADPISSFEFTWQGIPVSLIHSLAVERPNGDARHTTDSSVADWLERRQPPDGANVAFINGNPHAGRMGKTILNRLRAAGRSDLRIAVAGSAASPNLGHTHYLREIAANLYEDRKLRLANG